MKLILNPTNYLTGWLFVIFITSFVFSNTIKGTTPAFVLSLISLGYVLILTYKSRLPYLKLLLLVISIYLLLQLISQLFVLTVGIPNFSFLILVSEDSRSAFRSSLFTQTIYILCSFLLFVYVTIFYNRKVHDSYLSLSLTILVLIGFYFWLVYLFFGIDADFISNRQFGDGIANPGHFQTMAVAGIDITRFVSLTGEPSMYVFSVLPYLIYLGYAGYYRTAVLLLVSLILTFSGTFVVGLVVYGAILIVVKATRRVFLYSLLFVMLFSFGYTYNSIFQEIINNVIVDKINQDSGSGIDRTQSFLKHILYFFDLPLPLMLTGVGFGFIRSPEFFSTLLVNTGLIGFALFSFLLLYPVFYLSARSGRVFGIRAALLVLYVVMLTSVAEYSYPSFWLMLGIAYNELRTKQ